MSLMCEVGQRTSSHPRVFGGAKLRARESRAPRPIFLTRTLREQWGAHSPRLDNEQWTPPHSPAPPANKKPDFFQTYT